MGYFTEDEKIINIMIEESRKENSSLNSFSLYGGILNKLLQKEIFLDFDLIILFKDTNKVKIIQDN